MKIDYLLQMIDGGAVLVAVRHHPAPRKFMLRHPDNTVTGREGKQEEVTESTVIRLVNKGYVKPSPKDKLWDTIQYDLTEAGRKQARTGATDYSGAR